MKGQRRLCHWFEPGLGLAPCLHSRRRLQVEATIDAGSTVTLTPVLPAAPEIVVEAAVGLGAVVSQTTIWLDNGCPVPCVTSTPVVVLTHLANASVTSRVTRAPAAIRAAGDTLASPSIVAHLNNLERPLRIYCTYGLRRSRRPCEFRMLGQRAASDGATNFSIDAQGMGDVEMQANVDRRVTAHVRANDHRAPI